MTIEFVVSYNAAAGWRYVAKTATRCCHCHCATSTIWKPLCKTQPHAKIGATLGAIYNRTARRPAFRNRKVRSLRPPTTGAVIEVQVLSRWVALSTRWQQMRFSRLIFKP